MNYTFFTPGPSQLYPTVSKHIKTAIKENIFSISHRSENFKKIYRETLEGIKELLDIPEEYKIVFVASGTEAMERILENTVEKKSFHFVNGSFSQRWWEMALELKKDAKKEEVDFGKGFHRVPNISKNTELICFTHNETSSGVAIPPHFIYKIAKKYANALIAVDTVSSAPYIDLNYKKLDIAFFSVQKLFGLPAGLGVIILSPGAVEKTKELSAKGINIGSYHSFLNLVEFGDKYQTLETPSILEIYLLGQVVKDMNKKGIRTIRDEIEERANIIYSYLEQHDKYKPFVQKEDRSMTVIVAEVGDGKKVLDRLKQHGLIVGNGYGARKKKQIRIANFPAVSQKDIEMVLDYL